MRGSTCGNKNVANAAKQCSSDSECNSEIAGIRCVDGTCQVMPPLLPPPNGAKNSESRNLGIGCDGPDGSFCWPLGRCCSGTCYWGIVGGPCMRRQLRAADHKASQKAVTEAEKGDAAGDAATGDELSKQVVWELLSLFG